MKKLIFSFAILFCLFLQGCEQQPGEVRKFDPERLGRIRDFQENLIREGITGSNIALVYKDGEIIYRETVNSGLEGDADITSSTIFPIWSMSKPITTVAAMILYEEGKFLLDDPVSDYIPAMKELQCTDEHGNLYPSRNILTMRHLLAHRSGWRYDLY